MPKIFGRVNGAFDDSSLDSIIFMRRCRYKEKLLSNTQGTRVSPAEKRALFSAGEKNKSRKRRQYRRLGATVVLDMAQNRKRRTGRMQAKEITILNDVSSVFASPSAIL